MPTRERPRFAPSRRSLAGMLAGAAALALPVTVAVAASAEPDAELIALGHQLEAAWKLESETVDAAGEDLTDEIMNAVCRRTGAVVERIEAVVATTLAGLRVKLRALEWCMTGEPIDTRNLFDRNEATTDYRLVCAILNDLRTAV